MSYKGSSGVSLTIVPREAFRNRPSRVSWKIPILGASVIIRNLIFLAYSSPKVQIIYSAYTCQAVTIIHYLLSYILPHHLLNMWTKILITVSIVYQSLCENDLTKIELHHKVPIPSKYLVQCRLLQWELSFSIHHPPRSMCLMLTVGPLGDTIIRDYQRHNDKST